MNLLVDVELKAGNTVRFASPQSIGQTRECGEYENRSGDDAKPESPGSNYKRYAQCGWNNPQKVIYVLSCEIF